MPERKVFRIGDKVESSRTGWGQPYISGTVVAIDRDVVSVRLTGKDVIKKRSIPNLRHQDGWPRG